MKTRRPLTGLPNMTGHTGDSLLTDGVTSYWGPVTATTVLPTQTGHAGQFLTTDGTSASWAAITAATLGVVPTTRTLTAGAGLTGGGDLSADRTFDVVANADGSITVNANDIQVGVLASDAQHGVRGGVRCCPWPQQPTLFQER
jgi:hypothetical protein